MICEQCWKVQEILNYTCSGLRVCFVRVWDEPFRFLDWPKNRILKKTVHCRFFLMVLLDTQIVTTVNQTNQTIGLKIYWLIKKLSALKVGFSKNVPIIGDFTLSHKIKQNVAYFESWCNFLIFRFSISRIRL